MNDVDPGLSLALQPWAGVSQRLRRSVRQRHRRSGRNAFGVRFATPSALGSPTASAFGSPTPSAFDWAGVAEVFNRLKSVPVSWCFIQNYGSLHVLHASVAYELLALSVSPEATPVCRRLWTFWRNT